MRKKRVLSLLLSIALLLTMSLVIAPPATASSAVITGSVVNLRGGPGTSYPIIGKLLKGNPVSVTATRSGWYQVRTASGRQGWVSSQYVSSTSTSSRGATTSSSKTASVQVVVTGSVVNLRQSPSTSSAVVGRCRSGDILTYVKTVNGWYQIKTKDGKTAYIIGSLSRLKGLATQTSTPKTSTSSAPTTTVPYTPDDLKDLPTTSESTRSGKLQVIGSTVNLRSGPGTNYSVVGKVTRNQILYADKEQGGWYEVAVAGDDRAWISGSLVKILTPLAATTTTPSRGTDTRPTAGVISLTSGEDSQGDYLTLSGTGTTEPVVNNQDNQVTALFTGCRLPDQGIPSRVYINEDKSLGLNITATSGDQGLQVRVQVPSGLKYEVGQESGKVTIRIPGQLISLLPVTATTGREILELRATAPLTVTTGTSDQNVQSWLLSGLNVYQAVSQTGGSSYKEVDITPQSSGQAQARVELADGYLVDLIKINSDVYRFYFRPKTVAGQAGTIVIDPGHGGSDPGAGYFGAQEKNLTLSMGLKLGQVLQQAGYRVLYTRTDDTFVGLGQRCQIANQEQAQLFVSIHCNASTNPDLSGTTTYYWPSSDPYITQQRIELATAVQQAMINSLGTSNKGVRTGNYQVLRDTTMPSILVETAFLSNSGDYSILSNDDSQWTIAHAIADGITGYLTGQGITASSSTSSSSSDPTKPPGW